MPSPLSAATPVILQELKVSDIVALYQYKLGVDVTALFGGLETVRLMSCSESGLLFFDPCVTGDAAFYQQLQKEELYYMDYRPEFVTAARYVAGKDVLEVGCGVANFTNYVDTQTYTGLELNPAAVAMARQKGINVVEQLLADFLAVHEQRFGAVCVFQVLEHVQDIDGFIRSCIDACIDGGYLIFSLPAQDSFMVMARNQVLNFPPHHVSLWPDRVFPFIAGKYGLEMVELKHEPMEDIHKLWFLKVVVRNFLDRILRRDIVSNIDLSLSGKMLDKASSAFAWLLSKVFVADVVYPAGHTVTAIFRKKPVPERQ